MKTERLLRLANLIDQRGDNDVPFDLRCWGDTITKREGFLYLRKVQCNTAACAVGLACISKEFADDGLSHRIIQFYEHGSVEPVYGSLRGWAAVDAFFGLTPDQSHQLFHQDAYDGPTRGPSAAAAVSARIRQLVARSRASKRGRTVAEIKSQALAVPSVLAEEPVEP